MNSYNTLITSAFKTSPKFNALVELLTGAIETNTNIVKALPDLFDVDLAVGQQLDFVGEWVGINRGLTPPVDDTFFSFGIEEKGWHLGYWKDEYATTGITLMPDGEYRAVMKAKIALNQWKGNIPDAIESLSKTLPHNGFVITDYQDMSMVLGITGPVTPLVQALITRGYFDIRPAGVQISYETGIKFFGFGTNTNVVGGFHQGQWGKTLPLL